MRALVCLVLLAAWPAAVSGQVSPGELQVRLNITDSCDISGSTGGSLGSALLDFGTATLLQSAIDADTGTSGTQALEILCNPGVDYTLTFDAGQNATQVANRAMKRDGGTELVAYQIYSDSARNSTLTQVTGEGTGTAQPIVVYGRVPAQTAPPSGNYRDVVTITVSF